MPRPAGSRRHTPGLLSPAGLGAATTILRGTEASPRPGASRCFCLAFLRLGMAGRRVKRVSRELRGDGLCRAESVLGFNVLAVFCLARRL